MSELNIALATIGGLLLVLGLLTSIINHISFLSEPLLALLAGVLIGPAAFDLLNLASSGNQEMILKQAALITLGIALMGTALRLPVEYIRHNWRPLAVLLGLAMPLMWLSGSLLTYLILGLPFLVAVLIGAIVTPTDPVVASTIVTGDVADEYLPKRLRHTISAEAAFNDGLAYPFVLLSILILTRLPEEALSHWLVYTVLWEVVAAVALSALIGYGTGRVLKWAQAKETTEHTSLLTVSLALTLAILGAGELLGVDSVLAVFVAGIAFNAVASGGPEETADAVERKGRVQEAITRFFDLPIFVLLGMALPWEGWLELGWVGPILAITVLLLRRLPVVLALKPLLGQGKEDVLFLAWFGPIGATALYYATLSLEGVRAEEVVWVVSSLIICASLLAHGMTATPFTRLYGRRAQKQQSQSE
ncbi:MAG TPA: sodium:proton antiporter [Rubrobacteraceae bacterium]|nr:sodium:proton antiporter [Rubrobacteraceae bacterium]